MTDLLFSRLPLPQVQQHGGTSPEHRQTSPSHFHHSHTGGSQGMLMGQVQPGQQQQRQASPVHQMQQGMMMGQQQQQQRQPSPVYQMQQGMMMGQQHQRQPSPVNQMQQQQQAAGPGGLPHEMQEMLDQTGPLPFVSAPLPNMHPFLASLPLPLQPLSPCSPLSSTPSTPASSARSSLSTPYMHARMQLTHMHRMHACVRPHAELGGQG